MIEVRVNWSQADRGEVEAFLALPGVARALDALAHAPQIDDSVKVLFEVATNSEHAAADGPRPL